MPFRLRSGDLPADGVQAAPAAPGTAFGLGDQGAVAGRTAPGSGRAAPGSSRTGGRAVAARAAGGHLDEGVVPGQLQRGGGRGGLEVPEHPPHLSMTPPGSSRGPGAGRRTARPSGVKRSASPTWNPMAPSPVTRAAALSRATVRVSELQRVGSASSAKGRWSSARASTWTTPASPGGRGPSPIRTCTADPETSRPVADLVRHVCHVNGHCWSFTPRHRLRSSKLALGLLLSSTSPEGFLTAQLPSWMQDCPGLQSDSGPAGSRTSRAARRRVADRVGR